jgi:site-specific DNA-methyltransferase (adenine-specific)
VGGVVLDPFSGSGTTMLAATAEGFDSIGIELEKEYLEIANERLSRCHPS